MSFSPTCEHYGKEYFSWHESIGAFGGWANLSKFGAFIRPEDTVLDFGCGGGYLLHHLVCSRKIGIEINPEAIAVAERQGIEVHTTSESVGEASVDVIISNHALEHVPRPLDEIRALHGKLKPGGKIVFVVPCEGAYPCDLQDRNHHLYSWSPTCLANLFREAGFEVIECKAYYHKWPPRYRQIAKWGGRKAFDMVSRVYARFSRRYVQVRLIGRRGEG